MYKTLWYYSTFLLLLIFGLYNIYYLYIIIFIFYNMSVYIYYILFQCQTMSTGSSFWFSTEPFCCPRRRIIQHRSIRDGFPNCGRRTHFCIQIVSGKNKKGINYLPFYFFYRLFISII